MFKKKFPKSESTQVGQTLIETLVACFVLVMGISAALGLANYSLGATNSIKQQLVGMGLAREGLEVIKNMRDTNWLKSAYNTGCYNFSEPSANNGICYLDWLDATASGGYNISAGTSGSPLTYALRFNGANPLPWTAVQTASDFGLNTSIGTGVLYNNAAGVTPGGVTAGNSGFARRISISQDTFAPFNQNTGGRVKVTSEVWWSGKGCTMTTNPNPDKNCSVTLETYLTNWRVF